MNIQRLIMTGLLLAGAALSGGSTVSRVTPGALASWSVTGADRTQMSAAKDITLPAGAQLSREVTDGAVVLQLTSQPGWADASADWPILEVGPAAIAFVKAGNEGRLRLLVGDSQEQELPWSFSGDAMAKPMDLLLGYDPASGAVIVSAQDQTRFFQGGRSARPVEVALTAGDQSEWRQVSMELAVFDPQTEVAAEAPRRRSTQDESAAAAGLARLKSLSHRLRETSMDTTSASRPGVASDTARAIPPASTLEVYTPPAVRRGRAAEVRSALRGEVQR